MRTHRIIGLGTLFGFILSRAAATSYDAIHGMFRLTDLHLVGVIGLAIAIAAAGFAAARRRPTLAKAMAVKPMKPGLVLGGLMFGAGWAISGTCPGTAIAQLGEGTLAGGITILGIALGAYLRAALDRRSARALGDIAV